MLHLSQSNLVLPSVLSCRESYASCKGNRRSLHNQAENFTLTASRNSSKPAVIDLTSPPSKSNPLTVYNKEGLTTPPPETMNTEDLSYPMLQYDNYHGTSRGHTSSQPSVIPHMLDSFRSQHSDGKRKIISPPSRRGSFAQQQQQMKEESRSRRSSTNLSQSLTIPASINPNGGSLAEFAAQITCLFWFESSTIIHKVTESIHTPMPNNPLIPEAIPGIGFRKWVTTILSTTQVSQNVILLALLFIFRLKKLNPTVKGKPGSEFRLLTVALMLGNKFLDDNTYTNKTWAEVSGITVGEIHVMEVEFLSNMRYSLFTSKAEWHDWHIKLGKFGEFWDRAQRLPLEVARPSISMPITTLPNILQAPLPSPPSSNSASPPFPSTAHSPGSVLPPPLALTNYSNNSSVSPKSVPAISTVETPTSSRKRHFEDSAMQPPSKRLSRSGPLMLGPQFPISLSIPTPAPNPYSTRLPVTNNSSQTSIHTPVQSQHGSFFNTSRVMSTVYPPPPPPTTWYTSHSLTAPAAALSSTTSTAQSFNLSPFSQSKHSSPFLHNSNTSSPVVNFNNSPSVYLTSRESPYRPVRNVATLLAPPPGLAEAQHIGFDQMRYQPLAKARLESRTGLVPGYNPTDTWPSSSLWSINPQ